MGKLFISHSSKDDFFVDQLQRVLRDLHQDILIDSREFRGGDILETKSYSTIEAATAFAVVISADSIESKWVKNEVDHALKIQQQRAKPNFFNKHFKRQQPTHFPIIPLLLDDTPTNALLKFFQKEPIFIRISSKAGGCEAAVHDILVALGKRQPVDLPKAKPLSNQPIEELVLQLTDLKFTEVDGETRATALAELVYEPATTGHDRITSYDSWQFTAPLSPIDSDEIRWYLEKYAQWPGDHFQVRAEQVEQSLKRWGQALYQAAFPPEHTENVRDAWAKVPDAAHRRFSIFVNPKIAANAPPEQQLTARTAAIALLNLPWELLHDRDNFLFQSSNPLRVRRRLPKTHGAALPVVDLPISILLITARPEDNSCGYLDHRASALPLVEAMEKLGGLVKLSLLNPPTLPALSAELARAQKANKPYHVVHFDGHGVYDRSKGLGGLCFEEPQDVGKLENRRHHTVYTDDLGPLLKHYRIPLVFLEACQTAQAEQASESVASELLKVGVASVVAMSHSVLVSTASLFVAAFYASLAEGERVGDIVTGLAAANPHNRLSLDPALCPYLREYLVSHPGQASQQPMQLAELQSNWAIAMIANLIFLYEQQAQSTDQARMVVLLTSFELNNIFALLQHFQNIAKPEGTMALCAVIYGLLQNLGRPRLLEQR